MQYDNADKKDYDVEKSDSNPHIVNASELPILVLQGDQLKRDLKSRHIQMISIGGVIGTGLFLGTANALRHGGPVGLLLGYMTMGSITACIMISLGEMIAHLPLPGGHITMAQRFVNPAFSFTMGWNYWYNWLFVLPAELNAAAVLIGYWNNSVNPAVWIAICLIVAAAINLGGTRAYGEMEFWFAIVKVLTIISLIILGIILDAGGGPDHDVIGFRFWMSPGPFVQYLGIPGVTGRFLGYWAVLIQASFSYIGTEIVAITAGEAKNPRKNLPKAIKRVYVRILLFYICGTFIIGLLVGSDDPRLHLSSTHGTAGASPFVIAITRSGITVLPSIINAALLTSAWSAGSSDLYTSSRALYALAINGNAPAVCKKINRWGLPWVSVLVSIAFGFLSFMSAGSATAGDVFGYFADMTSVCGLLTWAGIAFTYIRFYNTTVAQGIDRSTLPYRSPLQPYAAYYALVFCCIILFFNGWSVFYTGGDPAPFDTATLITSYLPIVFVPILYFGYSFWRPQPTLAVQSIDFYGGSRDIEEEEELPPKNFVEKMWRSIM